MAAALAATGGVPAAATEAIVARLTGRAVLPAQTMVAPPADAPPGFSVSGRFAGGKPLRIEAVGSVEGKSPQAAKSAPRGTGVFLPMVGQQVQGFSGLKPLGDGEFVALTDNGFGSRANSPDSLLMLPPAAPGLAGRSRGTGRDSVPA